MAECDIMIRDGEIVTAAGSAGCADIGVSDGTILQRGATSPL